MSNTLFSLPLIPQGSEASNDSVCVYIPGYDSYRSILCGERVTVKAEFGGKKKYRLGSYLKLERRRGALIGDAPDGLAFLRIRL